MSGRGLSFFKNLRLDDKPSGNDDGKLEELSDTPSTTSSFGRGRSMPFVPAPSLDSDGVSAVSQLPCIGRGLGRGLGRGAVSIFAAVPDDMSNSDGSSDIKKISGQFEDSPQKKAPSSGRGSSSHATTSDENKHPMASIRKSMLGLHVTDDEDRAKLPQEMKALPPPPSVSRDAELAAAEGEEAAAAAQAEDVPTVKKHGTSGQKFDSVTNCIMINCDKNFGVFEYDVRFQPDVDNIRLRGKYLSQLKDVLGLIRTFDGVTLYLPIQLAEKVTQLTTEGVDGSGDVKVTIFFGRQKRLAECIHLYNVLFDRIMGILNYQRVGRKSFDPTAPKIIPQHKLEVWPGFVKSVEEQEGGVMLLLDVSHRVLSQKTVIEFMTECLQKARDNWKDCAKKGIIGNIVLTRYNNKSYRIDDIDFSQKPTSTFKKGDKEISYAEYYKNEYNIVVQDLNQPMLISRKEVRVSGQALKQDIIVCLVPELCNLTGLSDEMRSNYIVMKDLATYTKLTPMQRVDAYKKYIENIAKNEKASALLAGWGLTLEREPAKVTARLLDEETVFFGNDKSCKVGPQADFGRQATTNEVLEPMDIQNWILMYCRNDSRTADAFDSMLKKISGPTGIRCAQPRRVELPNDRTETYINEIRKQLKDVHIQIVVTIFPTLRDDRYAAVKKVLCVECPCPSQCINSKTLRNDAKNRSIVQKILLQMNCKLGGTLWGIKIPLKNTMIVGIDTYHEANNKGLTVGGLVATTNSSFTKYFSKPAFQHKGEELISGLLISMTKALEYYKTVNNVLPERIIIYRDGVGDGQLSFVQNYEISQFETACGKIAANYKPMFTFVVVQKRINQKFFKCVREMGVNKLVNPPPGSILDNTITRRTAYDFYLCSQHVREGTTTPSHYVVLRDDNNFPPDVVQKLTYKLTFLYYNWVGTVRVPAPCQYAHKLAYLVGLAVKRQVDESLTNKLFFL